MNIQLEQLDSPVDYEIQMDVVSLEEAVEQENQLADRFDEVIAELACLLGSGMTPFQGQYDVWAPQGRETEFYRRSHQGRRKTSITLTRYADMAYLEGDSRHADGGADFFWCCFVVLDHVLPMVENMLDQLRATEAEDPIDDGVLDL